MTSQHPEPVLACTWQAIPQAVRPTHQAKTQRVFTSVQEVRELPTGYAFRFPHETDLLRTITDFISYERLCCPFFRFELAIEPEQGPIWLSVGGITDMKSFIQSQGWVSPEGSAQG